VCQVTEGTNAGQLSPDGKWWWDGASWRPVRRESGLTLAKRLFDFAVIGSFCWVAFPLALALLLAVITPTYWGPMLSAATGIGLLVAGVVAIGIGAALTEVARRLVRPSRGRLLAGLGILTVAFLIQFVTLWIVLLGPALILLSNTRQP
jgi:hypothetical protein